MIRDFFLNTLLRQLEHITHGSITLHLPNGCTYQFSGAEAGANADFTLHRWGALPAIIMGGDIGMTEAYRDGLWDTSNLTNLLVFGLENSATLDGAIYSNRYTTLLHRVMYRLQHNTVKGSRRNISAHYDLGNAFYKLWLDESMSYSSAIFTEDAEPLVNAQHRKYDRILERLNTNSGSMLEIGCGWGGMAERAMIHGDYAYKGITLSHEQQAYAHQRLHAHNPVANIALEDYRHQQDRYQHIVSIEMFEAVGERYWPVYFSKLANLLEQKGKAIIQTITIEQPYAARYRKGGDMIRSFIFPGGMLPTEKDFSHQATQQGLQCGDTYRFGKDYATTLQHWLDNFEQNLAQIRQLGFDEKFIRVWRFYLAGCIASFSSGRTNVVQIELQHARL